MHFFDAASVCACDPADGFHLSAEAHRNLGLHWRLRSRLWDGLQNDPIRPEGCHALTCALPPPNPIRIADRAAGLNAVSVAQLQ